MKLGSMSAAGVACVLAFAPTVVAQERGDWIIRGRVIGVLPDESADITPINGDVDISNRVVPEVDLTYFFADRIGVEVIAAVTPHDVTATKTDLGDIDLGDVTLLPPTVTLQYHHPVTERTRVYGGIGVNYTTFFNDDLPDDTILESIDYDDSFGLVLQIGVDHMINENWMVNFDVKRVEINPEVTVNAGDLGIVTADVDIDPFIVGIGVGRKF